MIAAVLESDLEINHREASKPAVGGGFLNSFFDRRYILFRYRAAEGGVDQRKSPAACERFDLQFASCQRKQAARPSFALG